MSERTRIATLLVSATLGVFGLSAGTHIYAQDAAQPKAAATATPRTTDGRPDLSGYWGGVMGGIRTNAEPTDGRNYSSTIPLRNGDISNLTNDGVIARRSTNNLPIYK